MQSTGNILLVKPAAFGYNSQTAPTNTFQHPARLLPEQIQALALAEFNAVVDQLLAHHINIFVADDTPEPVKPDAVFPNNWISFSADGTVILYPMCTVNRRAERRWDIPEWLSGHFVVTRAINLAEYEEYGQYLEGTGSLVFDHINKVVYACLSPRTHITLVQKVAQLLNYQPVIFNAFDAAGNPIYHTNVIMCIGTAFAVVCTACIAPTEQQQVLNSLKSTGRQVLQISPEQMEHFAGNMLELKNRDGQLLLALSQTAYSHLTAMQREPLLQHVQLLPLAIPTIEYVGGGSIRCMMAEIFLPPQPTEGY